MRIIIVGLSDSSRGGISEHTQVLLAEGRKRHECHLVPVRRSALRWLYRSAHNQEVPERQRIAPRQALAVLDPAAPWSWRAVATTMAAIRPDLVVVTWWATTYWILPLGLTVRALKQRHPAAQVVYWCHDVRAEGRSRVWAWLARWSLRQADGFLLHSHEQLRALRLWLENPVARVTALPTFESRFAGRAFPSRSRARQHLRLRDDAPVLLFFGYVSPYKGLADLLDAVALARAATPGLQLMVAGEFREDVSAYRRHIDRLGLSTCVQITDRFVEPAEVPTYFAAANAVILPYRDATQSGVIALAHTFAVPVIATRVGGVAEAVVPDVTGLLVPPADPCALVAAITRFFAEQLEGPMREEIRQHAPRTAPHTLVACLEEIAAALRTSPVV